MSEEGQAGGREGAGKSGGGTAGDMPSDLAATSSKFTSCPSGILRVCTCAQFPFPFRISNMRVVVMCA